MAHTFQRPAKELWMALNRVEQEGWLYLHKRDYNLLMLLRRFAGELMNASFAFRKSDHSNLVDRYVKLENAYLLLLSREEYPRRIVAALEELARSTSELFPAKEDPRETARLYLSGDRSQPSLGDFLVAVNICKYRSMLSLDDLIRPDLENPVRSDVFECSPGTQTRIQTHIERLQQELENDRARLLELESVAQELGDQFEGTQNLRALYRDHVDAATSFDTAAEKLIEFLPHILAAYRTALFRILDGTVKAGEGDPVALFPERENKASLDELERVRVDLERRKADAALLSRERYRHLLDAVEETLEAEFPAMHAIEDARRALNRIKSNCFSALHRENTTAEARQNLHYPIAVTQELLLYLDDPHTREQLREEDRLAQEIRAKLTTLERIADVVTYHEARDRFVPLIRVPQAG